MDDRGANIDIVFRNGLKDYEVLPPQDVWDNIRPAIRKKQLPLVIFRAAAMIAVVLSLSLLAYRFSREISAELENPVIALNPESVTPLPGAAAAILPYNEVSQNRGVFSRASIPDDLVPEAVKTDNIFAAVQNIENPPESDDVSDKNNTPAELTALSYGRASYFNPDEENSLTLPDNTGSKGPNRWSISALFAPTYQSRITSGENEAVSRAMAAEQNIVNYSGGLALSYKINRRFSIQSGLYYSTIGKELTGINAYSGFGQQNNAKGNPVFAVTTSDGTIRTSNSDIFLKDGLAADRIQTYYNNNVFDPVKESLTYLDNSVRQNFSYLELPVILRYKVIDRALDFNIIGGVSSNLLVNNSVYASADGSKTQVGTTEGLNLITFSSSLGMGMEYSFANNLSLNLEPTFRYYISPFNDIDIPGMKIHPYSFGVFSGITYKF